MEFNGWSIIKAGFSGSTAVVEVEVMGLADDGDWALALSPTVSLALATGKILVIVLIFKVSWLIFAVAHALVVSRDAVVVEVVEVILEVSLVAVVVGNVTVVSSVVTIASVKVRSSAEVDFGFICPPSRRMTEMGAESLDTVVKYEGWTSGGG